MLNEVSILMPTRNRVEDLKVTINNMKSIGFYENQFFIIDDASTDNTTKIICNEFPEINISRNEQSIGQLNSRNILFANVKTPYALSLDDDSHIRSQEDIIEAITILQENAGSGIFAFKAFEQIEEPPNKSNLSDNISGVRTFIACGCLVKMEALQQIGNYTRGILGFYFEEVDCSIRMYMKGYNVITKENLVVHHRVNRKFRKMPKKTDIDKGIYGSVWRSKIGFSDNLIVTSIYYPFGFDILFVFIYIIKRAWDFGIKKGDISGFLLGISRYIKFIPYIMKEKQPMKYKLFKYWITLKTM